jgi:hypothetical protein
MVPITAKSASLYKDRRFGVRRLVSPLLPQPPNIIVEQTGLGRNAYTLSVLPSNRQPSTVLNPEEVMVRTRAPNVLMNYYETWRKGGEADEYYLDILYMHMHIAARPKSQQVLSLHCDPSMRSSEPHYRYKRGPHFHFEGAAPDVSRAHVSVCLVDRHLGGSNLEALMATFGEEVRLIAAELLPCWERAGRN